jgi:uncharacterized YigZ family protein
MNTSYKTIKSSSEGIYKEKGSKFIALASPVANTEDIENKLLEIKKQYHDARHHCYAYVLGYDSDIYRANDDGEPNHSAGDPILGQIKSFNLTNTLVVVVRYFGGTKLGVSGLINAYKTSTKDALDMAIVITKKITKPITLTFPYQSTNEAMKLVNDMDIKVSKQSFDTDCQIDGLIPIQNMDSVSKKVKLLNDLGVSITLIS